VKSERDMSFPFLLLMYVRVKKIIRLLSVVDPDPD
jgi:hypothetical protein